MSIEEEAAIIHMSESGDIISDGSLLNFEFDSLTGWALSLGGDDTVVQMTSGSDEIFRNSSNAFGGGHFASVSKAGAHSLPTGNIFTFTGRFRINHLGTSAQNDAFAQTVVRSDAGTRLLFNVFSDNIRINGPVSGWTDHSMTAPLNEFFDITFVQSIAERVADVYLNNDLVGSGLDSGQVGAGGSNLGIYTQSNHTPYSQMVLDTDQFLLGEALA